MREYIKARFQDAEKYIDNRKNGGHTSLKANNTSLKEIQNATPTSEGREPMPKPRIHINFNNSHLSLKNAPQFPLIKCRVSLMIAQETTPPNGKSNMLYGKENI